MVCYPIFLLSRALGINFGNIFDFIIICVDIAMGIITLSLWTEGERIVPLFGSFITLRLLVMMTNIPGMAPDILIV